MIELKDTGVKFIDDTHQYFLGDKELSGITKVLRTKLFPDMYKGIPQQTLTHAADKGSAVHEQIELVDTIGITPSLPEVKAYVKMEKDLGYETVANEYIVTDFDFFASGIDLVVHKIGTGDEVELWDIKHTYNVHKAYVEWQLSIYKAWFEAINPDIKVTAIKCLWLRDDRTRGLIHKLIPLNPHSADEVKKLFESIEEDKPYSKEEDNSDVKAIIEKYQGEVIYLTETIDAMKSNLDAIKKQFLEDLQKYKTKKVDTGRIVVSLKAGSKSTFLDTKAFQEKDSDLYEQLLAKYSKTTVKGECLQIKIKEEK